MEDERPLSPVVVKVGGSLFDWPDLGPRLRCWLDRLDTREVVLIPGGGATADVVRRYDQLHGLGEETSHWLALRVLGLNAAFLAALLPATKTQVVDHPDRCPAAWQGSRLPVLDGYAFACRDEGRPGCLPHGWHVTSDSLAVRVAELLKARRLVLLKSVTLPEPANWTEAGGHGLVDPYFAEAMEAWRRNVPQGFEVRAVNVREWRP